MSEMQSTVNDIAMLTNVALSLEAVRATMDRDSYLPGIMCLHGRSGLGKSMAAAYLTVKYDACFVRGMHTWATRAWLEAVLKDLGLEGVKGTNSKLMDAICEELADTQRMLILDEADYLVDKGLAQLVMDFYEGSECPILIVGEENLPHKLLSKHAKIHRRILHWIGAQPASMKDCRKLADLYVPGVSVADDLLEHINKAVDGCTGRVAVNLSKVKAAAKRSNETQVDREWWGERTLDTGKPESRRAR